MNANDENVNMMQMKVVPLASKEALSTKKNKKKQKKTQKTFKKYQKNKKIQKPKKKPGVSRR